MPLPLTLMFLPGCSLSLAIPAATPVLIRVVFCQSARSIVVDTTTFGKLFIVAAIGSPVVSPLNALANFS